VIVLLIVPFVTSAETTCADACFVAADAFLAL
jgi:hypothetical protein